MHIQISPITSQGRGAYRVETSDGLRRSRTHYSAYSAAIYASQLYHQTDAVSIHMPLATVGPYRSAVRTAETPAYCIVSLQGGVVATGWDLHSLLMGTYGWGR